MRLRHWVVLLLVSCLRLQLVRAIKQRADDWRIFEVSSLGHQLMEAPLKKRLKQSGLRRNNSLAHRLQESLVNLSQKPGEQGLAAMWKLIAGEGNDVVTLERVHARFSGEPAEVLSDILGEVDLYGHGMTFEDFKAFIQPAVEDTQAVALDYSLDRSPQEVLQMWEECGGHQKNKITKAEVRQKFQGVELEDLVTEERTCLQVIDLAGNGDHMRDGEGEVTLEEFQAFWAPKPVSKPEPMDPESKEELIQMWWEEMVGDSGRSTITVQDLGEIFKGNDYQSAEETLEDNKGIWRRVLGIDDGVDDATVKEEMDLKEWQKGMRRYFTEIGW